MTSPRSLLILALLASLTLPACAAIPRQSVIPIGQVQGEGARSALDGQTVTVEGIVSGAFLEGLGGFFVQDSGDGNPKTSDALFVAVEEGASVPTLAAGDRVRPRRPPGRVAGP